MFDRIPCDQKAYQINTRCIMCFCIFGSVLAAGLYDIVIHVSWIDELSAFVVSHARNPKSSLQKHGHHFDFIFLLSVILSLCSPYMAGAYIIILLLAICKRKKRSVWEENFYRIVRLSGCGSMIIAVIIVLGFVRKGGESWKTYLECIQMVMEDPEHMNTSILKGLLSCLVQLVKYN